ncbi:DUF87 domain-containing protein [candidate division WS5 bacterium]|uniref:DUF87 domain-containing protein n=1 Tax=candidate division WS5 bacterium TaxID=2093353 RepID=A0A419DE00_9BACT|nr:MAG: DUF87 domain-containing protein [candidate division WS5 bacterium]
MTRRRRLILLGLSLILLVIVGRVVTGDFEFILHQFWFTAGLFLLILLSLIDQPHFSKDANIFVNGTTGWISLLLVGGQNRDGVWWLFFIWATYLIISSYILMWIRSRELVSERPIVQGVSRVNRQIGRPEALFSAFFIWGIVQQFTTQSTQFNALLMFWVVFMILNLPAVANAIESIFSDEEAVLHTKAGLLLHVISPRVAEVALSSELSNDLVGKSVNIMTSDNKIAGKAILIDDRTIAGRRIGRLAITSIEKAWTSIGQESSKGATIDLLDEISSTDETPISVVDVGSEIGRLVFNVHPNILLQEGDVLWVQMDSKNKAFYQVISGQVSQISLSEGNYAQNVKVSAGQLGIWDAERCRFEPISWVAPAGQLVRRASSVSTKDHKIPDGHVVVGKVPNSDFPIHINIDDAITHNAAIIGVTGSGKSYLAFHIIESIVARKIKVLILDMSRQHYLFMKELNPTPLRKETDVAEWLNSEALIGIHQYAIDDQGFPQVTSKFVEAAFKELSKTKLMPGVNEPAKLCIVFEEAHSLIPEWNQVAQPGDVQHVNRTARIILQGRKYGIGSLIITQRTANVTKTILNQCNTIFALQSFDQTGLEFLKNYMGEEYSHALSTLPARHLVLVGKASSSVRPILLCIKDYAKRWINEDSVDSGNNQRNGSAEF